MQTHDDELHIGSDFERVYVMTNAPDLTGAKAIMKIRSLNDVELVHADCTVEEGQIRCRISGEVSKNMPRTYTKGLYDVFLVKQGSYSLKVIMGMMTIVPDESLH